MLPMTRCLRSRMSGFEAASNGAYRQLAKPA